MMDIMQSPQEHNDPFQKAVLHYLQKGIYGSLWLSYASGALTCMKYKFRGTTDGSSVYTFIAGLVLTFDWTIYGIAVHEECFQFVNAVGFAMHVAYITIFMMHTPHKTSATIHIILGIFAIIWVWSLRYVFAIDVDGLFNSSVCVGCFINYQASPLTQLVHAIKTWSADTLPAPMIFFLFILSFEIFIFACVMGDCYFLQVQHGVGMAITGALLMLCCLPWKGPETKDWDWDMCDT